MKNLFKYKIFFVSIIIIVVVLSYCNKEDPPLTPEDEKAGYCIISGDYNLEFSFYKGFINNTNIENEFLISSNYVKINGNTYSITFLVHWENPEDSSAGLKFYSKLDTIVDGKSIICSFNVTESDGKEFTMIAYDGNINIKMFKPTGALHKFLAYFDFKAVVKGTGEKKIQVTNGWISLERKN